MIQTTAPSDMRCAAERDIHHGQPTLFVAMNYPNSQYDKSSGYLCNIVRVDGDMKSDSEINTEQQGRRIGYRIVKRGAKNEEDIYNGDCQARASATWSK